MNDGFTTIIYFADKNHVYIKSSYCNFSVLEYATQAHFRIIDNQKGFVFFNGYYYYHQERLPYDLDKVKHFNDYYLQVDNRIYFSYINELKQANLPTFIIPHPELIGNIAMDKDHIFFRQHIIPDANPATFKIFGCMYSWFLPRMRQ